MHEADFSQGSFCVELSPIANVIVIFGASGDLTKRKLMPALYGLFCRNLFHPQSQIIACARTKFDTASYREIMRQHLQAEEQNLDRLDQFLAKITYLCGDYDSDQTYFSLQSALRTLDGQQNELLNWTFYLATPELLYYKIIPKLGEHGLLKEDYDGKPWRHVVLEKPFGHDTDSARDLDRLLHQNLHERQIYRIDHYLGKETVQNILILRFANTIFEPIWNNKYIDSVQITVAEDIGIGNRAGYFEKAGLLRDMFQNHMLEMLALVAMEMPSSFEANAVRDEKLKLIKAIRPFPINKLSRYIIRAQYTAGEKFNAYCQEPGVDPDSTVETYVAAKIMIDNWRWFGVPFYLRSGKRLKSKVSEIAIQFKKIPHSIFHPISADKFQSDTLVLKVQPAEGMALSIQAKQPGPKLCMGNINLAFNYGDEQNFGHIYDAYQRLLLDAMLGDQTLFIRSDMIAAAWELLTPVLQAWAGFDANNVQCPCHLRYYPAGSWGPELDEHDLGGVKWRKL